MKPNALSKVFASDEDEDLLEDDDDESGADMVTDSIMGALDLYAKGDKEAAADELKGAIEACVADYSA